MSDECIGNAYANDASVEVLLSSPFTMQVMPYLYFLSNKVLIKLTTISTSWVELTHTFNEKTSYELTHTQQLNMLSC